MTSIEVTSSERGQSRILTAADHMARQRRVLGVRGKAQAERLAAAPKPGAGWGDCRAHNYYHSRSISGCGGSLIGCSAGRRHLELLSDTFRAGSTSCSASLVAALRCDDAGVLPRAAAGLDRLLHLIDGAAAAGQS